MSSSKAWLANARRLPRLLIVLLLLASISLPLGISLPFVYCEQIGGDPWLSGLGGFLLGEANFHDVTMLGGIALLWDTGDAVLATVLLAFSVVFPIVKLSLLWFAAGRRNEAAVKLLSRLEWLGPWSMLDVFATAVVIIVLRGLPLGLIEVRYGFRWFVASAISATLAAIWLKKVVMADLTLER